MFVDCTAKKLARLDQRRQKLESSLEELPEGDEAAFDAVQKKLDALEEAEQTLTKDAPTHHAEATKAIGTAFLILDPDGRVRRGYRVPPPPKQPIKWQRPRRRSSTRTTRAADVGQFE